MIRYFTVKEFPHDEPSSPISQPAAGPFFGGIATTSGLFHDQRAVRRGARPHAVEDGGPFYPDRLPLDTDNDLIIIKDSITPAVGEITHLTGRDPRRAAAARSRTRRSRSGSATPTRCISTRATATRRRTSKTRTSRASAGSRPASTGEYRFRTIKPVPYPGRPAPHIHFKVKKGDRELLTSQINIAGHPGNDVDGVVLGGSACSIASC